jgi:hypothetical protein
MRRGIGVRKIKVKINNENARFFKNIVDKFIENPMSYDHKIKLKVPKHFPGT